MQLSKCCAPVPGDSILGYLTRGRGLTIHSKGCPNLETMDYEKDRLVEVEWDMTIEEHHSVKVCVLTIDRPGVLANVSSAISDSKANISGAEITTREDQKAVLDFVIENFQHPPPRTYARSHSADGWSHFSQARSWLGKFLSLLLRHLDGESGAWGELQRCGLSCAKFQDLDRGGFRPVAGTQIVGSRANRDVPFEMDDGPRPGPTIKYPRAFWCSSSKTSNRRALEIPER